jgi:hypothetical protein
MGSGLAFCYTFVVTLDALAPFTPRGDLVDGVGEFDAKGVGCRYSLRKARRDPAFLRLSGFP